MKTAHEFICDIAEKISMPDIYQRIRKLMLNPQASISDYVRLFQADSMLSLRIMRIANSDYFGFDRQAKDLNEAIRLIGIIQLHDLFLSSLCMRTFSGIPLEILNTREFWQHGVECGITARTIAKVNRVPGHNRYFTLGLLLEIGHAVMYIKTPELALQALLQSRRLNRPVHLVEREIFGFDYCQLGSAVMRVWHLPEVYPEIIEHYLSPALIKPELKTPAEIVNFAHRMCETDDNKSALMKEILVRFNRQEQTNENLESIVSNELSRHAKQVYAMLSPPN